MNKKTQDIGFQKVVVPSHYTGTLSRPLNEMATHESQQDILHCAGFDTGFFARVEGRGGILASDSISGKDIGICIVCFGLLVVFVFWYFDIVPTHTKNYTKVDIKCIWFAQL